MAANANASVAEWEVKEILDKRVQVDGRTEYLVKWSDWPKRSDSWEPEERLVNCEDAIANFEGRLEYYELLHRETGFDLGLKVKKVRGIRQFKDEELADLKKSERIFYIVEWEGSDRVDHVPSAVLREKAPQQVIAFWNSRIGWSRPGTNGKAPFGSDKVTKDTSPEPCCSKKMKQTA